MTQKKLTGKIRFGRPSGDGCDYISIEVTDDSSHTKFLNAEVKYADFALALTGLVAACEFKLHGAENVGKTRETKRVDVFVPFSDFTHRKEVAMKAVRALEQNGWVGRWENALNHNKLRETLKDGNTYEVVYTRLV